MSESSPIIIIGAPRSGTNMLRDVLCGLDGLETWPCDEINYIWRYGNRSYPNDQFPKALATIGTKSYITGKFRTLQAATGCRRVVEKTCASSLRVEFINEIFPTARFVHIVRDGVDVAVSASLRRKAELDFSYLVAKARYVPVVDIPFYAYNYLASRVAKVMSSEHSLSVWGPVAELPLPGYVTESAVALSAHQWVECVQASSSALEGLGAERYITVLYETFVQNPKDEILRVMEFLGETVPKNIDNVVSTVRKVSVGKGRRQMSDDEANSLQPLMQDTMSTLGYHWD